MTVTEKQYVCNFCIMDTTDPNIEFIENEYCNHCTVARERLKNLPTEKSVKKALLYKNIDKLKANGRGLPYDCIIGLSGGLDSSYLALKVVEFGLRPLAVHVDNGWNSELAVSNIENLVKKLDIELMTNILDWPSFKDLQFSFLKSSLANCEAPTDHAITATLFAFARKTGIKYILSGSNLATESIMPKAWGHYNQDLKLLRDVHKRFGERKLVDYPTISLKQYLVDVIFREIRQIPMLNFFDYEKSAAQQELIEKVDYRPYDFKHGESVWTRFFQNYFLPEKFGIDKRKAHLSSLVCAGQISRDYALSEMEKPIYDKVLFKSDYDFVLKKLGIDEICFKKILTNAPKSAKDFSSHYELFERLEFLKNKFRSIATSI